MQNKELELLLNKMLNAQAIQDYAPNGLQVEGRATIRKIVTGVTACQALIDQAIALSADAILVHHGYFWKNESPLVIDIKRNRLKALLMHDINLFSYHLPLDLHPTLGNNYQLGQRLGIRQLGPLSAATSQGLLFHGEFDQKQAPAALKHRLEQALARSVFHCGENAPKEIRSVAWCTGGGQDFITDAANQGVDAFITGEVSERTIHIARERGIHFFAGGHHATERYGVKALGDWLADNYGIETIFVDIDNPA